MTYYMDIERRPEGQFCILGEVRQHPYHLGTDLNVAMTFVYEQLRQKDVMSVCLREGRKVVGIYDFADLPENAFKVA